MASSVSALKVLVRVGRFAGWWVGAVARCRGVWLATGRSKVLEHGRAVTRKHLCQLNGLWVNPEKVMAQCFVGVDPLGRVKSQEAVQEVKGVGILDVKPQAFLDFPLVTFGKLDLVVQVQFFHSRPHLGKRKENDQ